MKEPAGYLNARQAAAYLGYEVGDGSSRTDPAMRAFYALVYRHRHRLVTKRRGQTLLFRKVDLDAFVDQSTEAHEDKFERMSTLAREHAAGESIHG